MAQVLISALLTFKFYFIDNNHLRQKIVAINYRASQYLLRQKPALA